MHRNVSLRNVRFNWLAVLEPKQFNKGDDHRYQAEVLIEEGSEAHKVLNEAVQSAAEEKWPGKGEGMVKVAASNGKCCRKEGDQMPLNKKTMEIPEYYTGNVVLATGRVLERDGEPKVYSQRASTLALVPVTKDTVFGADLVKPVRGNYGDVLVSLWGWEFNGAPQINCTLEAIAFRGEGDALGNQAPVTSDVVADAFGAEIEQEANPFE